MVPVGVKPGARGYRRSVCSRNREITATVNGMTTERWRGLLPGNIQKAEGTVFHFTSPIRILLSCEERRTLGSRVFGDERPRRGSTGDTRAPVGDV